MFRTVLVANRGEIARRVIQACRELGIRSVAVYSEVDADAPFVHEADEAYLLGDAPARASYLNIARILEVAKQSGAEAIHPGYGFLAENAEFAQACADAEIVFIGPRPEVIRLLGDKGAAKRAAERAGAPIVPGYNSQHAAAPDELLRAAQAIGFPVLLKAVAGGGGKGMRVVDSPERFAEIAESAAREAQNAFGDPRLMLERYLPRPRHIEVQILADQHGRVIHLHERECSIQRRHQKIIEESPSIALDADTRAAICDAAVRLAQTVGYTNAGTVEFLYEQTDDGGQFYFLEVNTRLQVEHPVTELVTGVDLVHWQLRIAAGEPLELDTPPVRGHAMEARLYAEDPDNDFAPSLGELRVYRQPHLPGVRFDSGVCEGATITHHYDPMLAKVIAHAPDRLSAIRRLVNALEQTVALGVRTNQAFLIELLQHPAFIAGALHTGFLEEHAIRAAPDDTPEVVWMALALAEPLMRASQRTPATHDGNQGGFPSPWEQLGRWRMTGMV